MDDPKRPIGTLAVMLISAATFMSIVFIANAITAKLK